MNIRQHLWPACSRNTRAHPSPYTPFAWLLGLASSLLLALSAHADDFSKVYYDASTDELVVTMIYSGTNPDHSFSLHWGQCKEATDGNSSEVEVEVLDSQWEDPARHDFNKTVRFGLTDLPCRPAKVTLRTAPRFIYSLMIPASPVGHP
jgi:hypothetical protein